MQVCQRQKLGLISLSVAATLARKLGRLFLFYESLLEYYLYAGILVELSFFARDRRLSG